jgi:S-adenosylmethionine synthetase
MKHMLKPNGSTLFTSESVSEGHPDKVCDAIADAILDDILANDPEARVAVEVACTTGVVMVFGEVTCDCYSDMNGIARKTIQSIGYHSPTFGFDGGTCGVLISIDEQSSDISGAVTASREAHARKAADDYDMQGAGDQGMMFGFACRESEGFSAKTKNAFMPLPIQLAHMLAQRLAHVRKKGILDYIGPDGKTQVTMRYENGKPLSVERVVVSAMHLESVKMKRMADDIIETVVKPVIPARWFSGGHIAKDLILVNPSGKFVKGGPLADSGLTGRKIIVDTYGGSARHGGGSFSGKDPSKVDRSASYYARYAAKNLVAAGAAERLEVQVAYAIGVADPVSVSATAFGTERVPLERINALLESREVFDFRPAAIIANLNLKRPIYSQVAAYGHFGRTGLDLPWEELDLVPAIKDALGKPIL